MINIANNAWTAGRRRVEQVSSTVFAADQMPVGIYQMPAIMLSPRTVESVVLSMSMSRNGAWLGRAGRIGDVAVLRLYVRVLRWAEWAVVKMNGRVQAIR